MNTDIKNIDNYVEALLGAVEPVKGETRVVLQCPECGHMWCKQFIPFSLSEGRGTPLCNCVATSKNVASRAILIKEVTP